MLHYRFQAERDLRVAQSEFDRQAEITKLLLEGIGSSQSSHLRHLHSLVEAQSNYYGQCLNAINDLQRDLVRLVQWMFYLCAYISLAISGFVLALICKE